VDDTPAGDRVTGPTVYKQPSVITAMRFSPDGKTIAVNGNREVLIHNADGSGLIRRLPGKAERILSVAFSKDGKLLVAGGGTPARFGEVQWWNPATGELLRSAEATTDTVFGASISPDASKVAVGCADNTARVFESATGKELYKLSSHEDWVLATVFGVDGKRFVSVGRDRAAKLVNATDGRFIENVNQLAGELSAVARHPSKDEIVIGGIERYPYIYRLDRPRNMKVGEDATLIRKLERQDGTIFALDWSPDGKQIAVGGAASEVTLYNAETGERMGACKGHSAGIYTLDYSPDGTRLATGGFDGTVRIYNPGDCSLVTSFVPVPIGN
jgi:WD40 repeat protein